MEKRVWKGLNGLLTEKRVAVACCVLLGLTLLPVAALSVYNHPCSDDYSYGLYVAQAVRSGKALYVGLSNYDGPTLEKAYCDFGRTACAVYHQSEPLLNFLTARLKITA